jgi:hypothetical protein
MITEFGAMTGLHMEGDQRNCLSTQSKMEFHTFGPENADYQYNGWSEHVLTFADLLVPRIVVFDHRYKHQLGQRFHDLL